MNKLKEILGNVKTGWAKMDNKKKMGLISVVMLIFLSVALLTYFNRVTYAPLFTNLDLDDSGRIVEDLKTKNIDYKLENGGKDILIDEKLIDGYRIEVATEGNMPEKSSGFEMFDNMGMMATDEDRQIMYQRALSGELQRSIMSLDGIRAAKVHLVMPEKSIFETEKKAGSASVVVDVDPSTKINNDTIRGMAALVYGAVDNVPEENIQIIDSKGNLLSGFLKDEKADGTLGNIDSYSLMREDFQKEVETNLDTLLTGVFGREKVKVSVFADLDFDAEETTVISYRDPITRSEQATSITDTGVGGNIGDGDSNVVGDIEDGDMVDWTRNNELTTETRTTIKAPGKVRKLTTSVVYDGTLSPEAEDQMLNIVAAATGYDVDRGDFISIEGINFDRTYEEDLQAELDAIAAEEAEAEGELTFKDYAIYGLIGLFALLLIIGVIRTLRSRKKTKEDPFPEQFPMDVPISELEQATAKVVEKKEEEEIKPIEVKKDVNQIKANEFADKNPEIAADLIKAWMKE